MLLNLYEMIMGASGPLLQGMIGKRARAGKEDMKRLGERMGHASRARPKGRLGWLHAASVGEAQSGLILIREFLARWPNAHVLVTTGTVTSANFLEKKLPSACIHQYCPLDHPEWVRSFLDHWRPDFVLWLESELWPLMLREIRRRAVPAALVNARMSDRSFRRWKFARGLAADNLSTFGTILAQSALDAQRLEALGARNVSMTGNLKYCASPLPCDADMLASLQAQADSRPLWLFASTHEGEEALACRVHARLRQDFPGLLTIVAPRHPARREAAEKAARAAGLSFAVRTADPRIARDTNIYIADTLGELGLFYRLCPAACIGRSFSEDGGGGHNPIEAAQLGCAVLHGPDVHNFESVYREMNEAAACIRLGDEKDLAANIERLLRNPRDLADLQQKALRFADRGHDILDRIMTRLDPVMKDHTPQKATQCA